jgi:hypothetical protein
MPPRGKARIRSGWAAIALEDDKVGRALPWAGQEIHIEVYGPGRCLRALLSGVTPPPRYRIFYRADRRGTQVQRFSDSRLAWWR